MRKHMKNQNGKGNAHNQKMGILFFSNIYLTVLLYLLLSCLYRCRVVFHDFNSHLFIGGCFDTSGHHPKGSSLPPGRRKTLRLAGHLWTQRLERIRVGSTRHQKSLYLHKSTKSIKTNQLAICFFLVGYLGLLTKCTCFTPVLKCPGNLNAFHYSLRFKRQSIILG